MNTVVDIRPPAAAPAAEPEPLEVAMLELSAHIAALIAGARRGHPRVEELRTLSPGLRRRRRRPVPPAPPRPLTFFSIEEADASSEPERPRAA